MSNSGQPNNRGNDGQPRGMLPLKEQLDREERESIVGEARRFVREFKEVSFGYLLFLGLALAVIFSTALAMVILCAAL